MAANPVPTRFLSGVVTETLASRSTGRLGLGAACEAVLASGVAKVVRRAALQARGLVRGSR